MWLPIALKTKHISGLPKSGKNLENEKMPGQGKVRNFIFSQGNLEKMKKCHGKVRDFQNLKKKMLFNKASRKFYFHKLQAIIRKGMFLNINCKQFMFRNFALLILMV